MKTNEIDIWQKIGHSRTIPLDGRWLVDVYLTSIDLNLKRQIAERIGYMGYLGWPLIKELIDQKGIESELICAAGLSHQAEAKDWLLKIINYSPEIRLEVLRALSCWGAEISTSIIKDLLKDKSKAIRLACLELIHFKAYQLKDTDLIDLLEESLDDFREEVQLTALKILRRRNSDEVCRRIAQLVEEGSEEVTKSALIALGCIGNAYSQSSLLSLSKKLTNESTRNLAIKQLKYQYKILIKELEDVEEN